MAKLLVNNISRICRMSSTRPFITGLPSRHLASSVSGSHDPLSPESRAVAVGLAPKRFLPLDTLASIKYLMSHDFTQKQAEGLVSLLVECIQSNNEVNLSNLVTKEAQEIVVQQLVAQISSVKKDMVILEKSEFSALRNETDKLLIEMARVRDHLNDELVKMRSGLTLDMNLERGRSMEAQSDLKNELNRIDHKIGTEVANLKTTFESYRNDLFKYGAGTVISCLTISLGFYRLWS